MQPLPGSGHSPSPGGGATADCEGGWRPGQSRGAARWEGQAGSPSLGMTQVLLGSAGLTVGECLLPAGVTVTNGSRYGWERGWCGPSPVGLVLNTGDNDHSVHGRQCFVSSHAGLAESCDFPCFAGEETEAQRGRAARQVAVQQQVAGRGPRASLMPGLCLTRLPREPCTPCWGGLSLWVQMVTLALPGCQQRPCPHSSLVSLAGAQLTVGR